MATYLPDSVRKGLSDLVLNWINTPHSEFRQTVESVLTNYGLLLIIINETDLAEKFFKYCCEFCPSHAPFWYNRAQLCIQLKQPYTATIEFLECALEHFDDKLFVDPAGTKKLWQIQLSDIVSFCAHIDAQTPSSGA